MKSRGLTKETIASETNHVENMLTQATAFTSGGLPLRKLVAIMIAFALSFSAMPVSAEETTPITLEAFQEYNQGKIQLKAASIELFKVGAGVSFGNGGTVVLHDGSVEQSKKSVPILGAVNRISWVAFCGDRFIPEEEVYRKLGLENEAEKARKSTAFYRSLFYGGAGVLLAGFVVLCGYGVALQSSDTIDPGTYNQAQMVGVAAAGGAISTVIANKRLAKRVVDFPNAYRQVKQHNLQLLKNRFPGMETGETEAALAGIRTMADVAAFEQRQLGLETSAKSRNWEASILEQGLTREEILERCGIPDGVESCGDYAAWEYVHFLPLPARMFDWGRFTHESYRYMRYILYFENGCLIKWWTREYNSYEDKQKG